MAVKRISSLIQACVLCGAIFLAMPSGSSAQGAGDTLRNIGPGTQDASTCNQMQNYSAQLADIRSQTQEWSRRSSWRRVCNILGQATSLLAEMISFMRAHIGECNITPASLSQASDAARGMAEMRARRCR
jgi:hypothetical protein